MNFERGTANKVGNATVWILSSGSNAQKMSRVGLCFRGNRIQVLVRLVTYCNTWTTRTPNPDPGKIITAQYRTSTGITFNVNLQFNLNVYSNPEWKLLEEQNEHIAVAVFKDLESCNHNIHKGDVKMEKIKKQLIKDKGFSMTKFKRDRRNRLKKNHLYLLSTIVQC